jgi:hypothetical protein
MLAREKSFVFERVHLGILGIVRGTGQPIRTSRGRGSASGDHSPAVLTARTDLRSIDGSAAELAPCRLSLVDGVELLENRFDGVQVVPRFEMACGSAAEIAT